MVPLLPRSLPHFQARAYEQGIIGVLTHARRLVNSFHIAIRPPPEVLYMISSYLTEEDLFSASQVCWHWRADLSSFPFLWARVSCHHALRATASLSRCGSLPIQLRIQPRFLDVVLEDVLLHGNKIDSLIINYQPRRVSRLRRLLELSRPSVRRLQMYANSIATRVPEEPGMPDIWQDFSSLRELFVCEHTISLGQLVAPNLVHLALEHTGYEGGEEFAVQTILNTLRGCPLLETLLLNYAYTIPLDTPRRYSSTHLPHLRSLEVGPYEVHSGLITYLDFPPNATVGFRRIHPRYLGDDIPPAVLASLQHVLQRVDIRCVTLAASGQHGFLFRFKGQSGSLEITTTFTFDGQEPVDLLLSKEGVLFSHCPFIEGVTELHIVGCYFYVSQGLDHVKVAMPNVHTVSFFNCGGPHVFELLTSENHSPPPFPRLERVMVSEPQPTLEKMALRRVDLGVPLKTLVIGRGPGTSNSDRLEEPTALKGLVDDLRIGSPTEILEWGAENKVLDTWSAPDIPILVNLNGTLPASTTPNLFPQLLFSGLSKFKFCRFELTREGARR